MLIFFKTFIIYCTFQNYNIKQQIFFYYFLDNCIWICTGRISVLWRKYLSFLINVLISCCKVSDVNKNDSFLTQVCSKWRKSKIKTLFFSYEWHNCLGVFTNGTFYAFKEPRVLEWIISEILKLWGSFFQNVQNLMYISKI